MSKMIVEVNGIATVHDGYDGFRNAVRDTVRAVSGKDHTSPNDVKLIDCETGEILSNIKKGQRTGCE